MEEEATKPSAPKRHACKGCYSIKARCLEVAPDFNTASTSSAVLSAPRCARCVRLNIPCETRTQGTRGRKRNGSKLESQSVEPLGTAPLPPPPMLSPPELPMLNRNHSSLTDQPPRSGSMAMPPWPAPTHPLLGASPGSTGSHHLRGGDRNWSVSSPSTSVKRDYEEPDLSFVDAAEVKASSAPKPKPLPTMPPKSMYPDPVELNILTFVEADVLFANFHKHLNPLVKLFDRNLHTTAYTRATSDILFTAMLAVASKFFRKDLYPTLLAQARQLVARALTETRSDIGSVQAICILVYWKEPHDKSAWMRVGWAIRLGLQLRLNLISDAPLPEDVHEARLVLDRKRTWFNLICFDMSYRLNRDFEDSTLQPIPDQSIINQWLEQSVVLGCWEDLYLGTSLEGNKIERLAHALAHSQSPSASQMLASHISQLLEALHLKYFDPSSVAAKALAGTPSASKAQMTYATISVTVSRASLIATEFKNDILLVDFAARVTQYVATLEEVAAQEGFLDRLQDATAIALFGLGEFLVKLFTIVGPGATQAAIIKWLTQVYAICSTCAVEREDGAPAFISRFYRRLLQLVSSESLPSTRPSSAGRDAQPGHGEPASGHIALPEQFDIPGDDLLQFNFNALGEMPVQSEVDTDYWGTLFSNSTDDSWAWLATVNQEV